MTDKRQAPPGCSFLVQPISERLPFIAEDLTQEQRQLAATAEAFMQREVLPDVQRLEAKEPGLMVAKLRAAAEVGLLMIDIPEAYGGLDLDKVSSMRCAETLGTYASFSVSHGAHTGIGMLPLVFFGTHEQKERYLPRMATGELLGAYALTEPGSGSDALGARTTAIRTTDSEGQPCFRLNGTKMWITNAGFADLFTVFAKVDGEHFTAFLVEAAYPGVSTGAEEHKMGLRGSSTRLLILEDVLVPAHNVLGEIGRGHKIAFNILNFGRYKLGVGVLGAAKRALELAISYAKVRHQFGQPIAAFGAIREKLARMTSACFALEAMCYRVAGDMDLSIGALDSQADSYPAAVMAAIEDYAVEDSIMKVYGSEVLDFVVDEAVQVHGGLGYSEEYEVERLYRDSRINRIFEGTNEINRLLIPGMLVKRILHGQLDLSHRMARIASLAEARSAPAWCPNALDQEVALTEALKDASVFVAQEVLQAKGPAFKEAQALSLVLADLLIATYSADSTLGRVLRLQGRGAATRVHCAIAQAVVAEATYQVRTLGESLLASLSQGDTLRAKRQTLAALLPAPETPLDLVREEIAAFVLERERWPFV